LDVSRFQKERGHARKDLAKGYDKYPDKLKGQLQSICGWQDEAKELSGSLSPLMGIEH
jgi:hypothetical protein